VSLKTIITACLFYLTLGLATPVSSGSGSHEKRATTVYVGFGRELNWDFVSKNAVSQSQILSHTPRALAHEAGVDVSQVTSIRLQAYDTTATLGYITTLALFSYPGDTEMLRIDMKIPSSPFYNHPDPLTRQLTRMVNPNIDPLTGQMG
jgi:hypothetical protein